MRKHKNRTFILISIILGMFLSAIEATIVATAMPSIVKDLGDFKLYSWVFSSYLLSSSATILLFGKLADVYGRKPIYIFGTIVFLSGSTLAGFSHSMFLLVVARFIQGVGAGALIPMTTTIVGDIYTKEERAKIQGYLSAVWGISAILGPLIGAFFVEWLDWRYVFWMNIPLGLLSLTGIVIFFKENIEKSKQQLDIVGMLLFIASITVVIYILVEGGISIRWNSPFMYVLIGIVIVAFSLFLMTERRTDHPMLPPSLWSYRLIRYANITSILTGVILISVSSYLPVFVQVVMEQSALIAGFTLTTMSIGWPIASTIAGRLLLKIGYRTTSLIGGIFLIVGAIFFIILPTLQQTYLAAIGSFFIGIGMGMTSTAFIVAIQTTVKWEIRGIATATNMFMRTIGSALGAALLGGVLNNQIMRNIEAAQLEDVISIQSIDLLLAQNDTQTLTSTSIAVLKEGLITGLEYVYIGMGIIAIASFIFIIFIPKKSA